jgi:hypothetical protein
MYRSCRASARAPNRRRDTPRPIDLFEHVFEHVEMSAAPLIDSSAIVRQQLQARIAGMQATRLDEDSFSVRPEMRSLLPSGLRRGAVYAIEGSTSVALALMAAPSAQGEWCGVLGMPDLGLEAAAGWGIDLDRLAWVDDPGERWLTTVAAMCDVLGIVLARAPRSVSPAETSRLAARLRQSRSTLLLLGDWPQAESTLRVVSASWRGLGTGYGHLTDRQLRVEVRGRNGSDVLRLGRVEIAGRP